MSYVIDINCDMGESFGNYTLGIDHEVIKYISSSNIGCGFHGGDPNVMEKTVSLCKNYNVAVGAHPGFPDLIGFGRRNMDIPTNELSNYVLYQLGALEAFAKLRSLDIQHVKLHGALYNMAAKDKKIALAIAETIKAYDDNLIFLVLANSEMENAAVSLKMRYACEIFADRNYNSDGTLVSRSHPQALIKDSDYAAKRIVKIIKERKIASIDGVEFKINYHSLCVHGDNTEAVNFVRDIRELLTREGVSIKPMSQIV
jgi:UPF0271 protein